MNSDWVIYDLRRRWREYRWHLCSMALTFALALVVMGGGILGLWVEKKWEASLGKNVHVVVYLAEDLENARGLADIIRRLPTVDTAYVVEPAQARERLLASARALGGGGLDTMEASLFPRSLEIVLRPGPDLRTQARDLSSRLRPVPGVLLVDDLSQGLEALGTWGRLGKSISRGVVGTVLITVLVFPILAIFRFRQVHRARSRVMQQLGATPFAIRGPGALFVAGAAVMGGIGAAIFLRVGAKPFVLRLETLLATGEGPVPTLSLPQTFLGLFALLLAGFIVGYFAVPKGQPNA